MDGQDLPGFLGLTVGTILSQMPHEEKHAAYAADITYGTNNEFGFDYLRDNMAMQVEERFQRGLHYAIVDEVDSILIDEARTPLIISGQADDRTDVYLKMDAVAPMLEAPGDRPIRPATSTSTRRTTRSCCPRRGTRTRSSCWRAPGMLPEGASLYEPAHINLEPPPLPGAARAQPLLPRPALRRPERRGDHRRRVHRPADARPPLVGRHAPGGRGEGAGPDPEREPDARLDHLPELLPHVSRSSPA